MVVEFVAVVKCELRKTEAPSGTEVATRRPVEVIFFLVKSTRNPLAYAIKMILTIAKVIKKEMVESFFILLSITQQCKSVTMIYCSG